MDKILSARLDEEVIRQIALLAKRLGTSKKAVIEAAIRLLARESERGRHGDVLAETLGAWKRKEAPADTVERSRKPFRKSMERYRR